jgi:hypothetical protein
MIESLSISVGVAAKKNTVYQGEFHRLISEVCKCKFYISKIL